MLKVMILLILVFVAAGEDIEFSECGTDKSANCDIKAVRLSPCPKVSRNNPCKLKKGSTGELQFDFVPEFAAEALTANLYWVNGVVDLPLPGMDTVGCHSTHCPTVAGQTSLFSYNLTIQQVFPSGKYNVKALLKKDQENECCFEFTIKILS